MGVSHAMTFETAIMRVMVMIADMNVVALTTVVLMIVVRVQVNVLRHPITETDRLNEAIAVVMEMGKKSVQATPCDYSNASKIGLTVAIFSSSNCHSFSEPKF